MVEGYKSLAKQYDREEGLQHITDDYINSYKIQIEKMKEWMKRKEDQNYELMQKLASVKIYAVLLREGLERQFTQQGKVLPQEFEEAPLMIETEHEMELNRAEVRGYLKKKEEFLVGAQVDQLMAENTMIKNYMRQHSLLDHTEMLHQADEKVRLLQEVTDQQRQRLTQLEDYRDGVERERAKERTDLNNIIKGRE